MTAPDTSITANSVKPTDLEEIALRNADGNLIPNALDNLMQLNTPSGRVSPTSHDNFENLHKTQDNSIAL